MARTTQVSPLQIGIKVDLDDTVADSLPEVVDG
jgi:phosphatidate phosphatase APP1